MRSALIIATALATASAQLPAWSGNGAAIDFVSTADLVISATPGYDLIYGTAYSAAQGVKGTQLAPSKHTENIRFEAYALAYLDFNFNIVDYFQVQYKFKFYPIYYAPLDLTVTWTRSLES